MSDETRTTGPHSDNTIIHGWCQDLADQLVEPKALVYMVICLEAVEEQIIGSTYVMGVAVPEHESKWTRSQARDVVTLIQKRAAMLAGHHQRPFYLHEYDEDGKRTRKVWYNP